MIILKKLHTDKKIELFNVIDTYIMDFRTIHAYIKKDLEVQDFLQSSSINVF